MTLTAYQQWLNCVTDEETKKALLSMSATEIENAFYKDLEFGTGGLRGVMGAGSNCLNIHTVTRATKGLAKFMHLHGYSRAVITYDSRINSQKFAQTTAATLLQQGIEVWLTKQCAPTPFLSFLIRHLHCDIGVNITASHNPKQYNGYKVYRKSGCQILEDDAAEITQQIQTVQFDGQLPDIELLNSPLLHYVTDDAERAYIQSVLSQSLEHCQNTKVVYTPLNGAAHKMVPQVLGGTNVTDLFVVEEQSRPDGNFPTCPYPNPENHATLNLALNLAKQHNADVVIANDPDGDRLGVAINNHGEFVILDGNQVGILLCNYLLEMHQQRNSLPQSPLVVKTIVTTPLIDELAQNYGAQVENVLTGFKYIGDVIDKLEAAGNLHRYVFGLEESCGYLQSTNVRDKDGISAARLVCEVVSHYKKLGKNLLEVLDELYLQYGRYDQALLRYEFAGADGAVKKQQILHNLRTSPIADIAGSPLVSAEDLLVQTKLPKADVLIFRSADGSSVIIRPSGTEPLIKCYLFVKGEKTANARRLAQIKAQLDVLLA